MTEQELDAIEARANAATAGPWKAGGDVGQGEVYGADGWSIVGATEPAWEARTVDANATFIAHARTDVPALVAEVRRLRAVVNAARAWAECEAYSDEQNAAGLVLEAEVKALNNLR